MNASVKQVHSLLAKCRAQGLRLTALRRTVLDIILAEKGVIKAYDVLMRMEKAWGKIIAPPTIYRSLDFWVKAGVLHKVEAVSGYIVCRQEHTQDSHPTIPFILVCRACSAVFEYDFPALSQVFVTACHDKNFLHDHEAIVITGFCAECAKQHPKGLPASA